MKLPTKAIIEASSNLSTEEKSIKRHLTSIGIPIEEVSVKKFTRRQRKIEEGEFISGSIKFIHHALKASGHSIPIPNDYPLNLRWALQRKVWEGEINHLNNAAPVFMKPKEKLKKFTGKVFLHDNEPEIHWASKRTKVWFSEIITIENEIRVYIKEGQVLGIHAFKETPFDPNPHFFRQILKSIGNVTIALDLGLTNKGNTVLVETNDAYSLGNYGLSDKDYTEMLITRWWEIFEETRGEKENAIRIQ